MLIFLYNELLESNLQQFLGIELVFVSFAYIFDVKMFQGYEDEITVVEYDDIRRGYGNNKVYGAVYHLKQPEYLRYLDAYSICSKSVLGANHIRDTNHRIKREAVLIQFETLDELSRLLYNEITTVEVETYIGNIEKEHISKRVEQPRHRIPSGLLEDSFFGVFLEEG